MPVQLAASKSELGGRFRDHNSYTETRRDLPTSPLSSGGRAGEIYDKGRGFETLPVVAFLFFFWIPPKPCSLFSGTPPATADHDGPPGRPHRHLVVSPRPGRSQGGQVALRAWPDRTGVRIGPDIHRARIGVGTASAGAGGGRNGRPRPLQLTRSRLLLHPD